MRQASQQLQVASLQKDATTTEEKLGATMGFLRAAERGSQLALKRISRKYVFLNTFFDPSDAATLSPVALARVRDHAVQLARVDVWDRIEELRQIRETGPSEFVVQAHKENILVRLQRLLPGTTASLSVMRDKNHNLTSDPAEMAAILNEHWGSVFSRKDIARHKIASWLVDVPSFPASSDARWKLNREHVATAGKVARESAPGPDGIPYRAWKALGDLAWIVFFRQPRLCRDQIHYNFCHMISTKLFYVVCRRCQGMIPNTVTSMMPRTPARYLWSTQTTGLSLTRTGLSWNQ